MRTKTRIAKKRHGGSLSRKRTLLLCVAVALALAASLALLSGCKYSDVLTEYLEDPTAEADENVDPTYKDNPFAELELNLAETNLEDAENVDTQIEALPHYDPTAPDNGPTKRLVYNPDSPHNGVATEGQVAGEPDREGDQEGESNSQGGDGDSNTGSGTGPGDQGDPLQDNTGDEANPAPAGPSDTPKVDDDGKKNESPKGTVAAVGEYATIAQMLGGTGALVGTDQAWLDARSADGCFSGELDKVQVGFKDDGTPKLKALTDTIKPSVILWDATGKEPNLSDSDRKTLEAAGIKVQQMPHLGEQYTEDADITAAVSSVASILTGATGIGKKPDVMYSNYVTFHDNVLKSAYNTKKGGNSGNSGYAYKFVGNNAYQEVYQDSYPAEFADSTQDIRRITVFVNELASMGSSRTVERHTTGALTDSVTLDTSDGVGISAHATNKYELMDYYLQLAGVVNNSYDTAKPSSDGRSSIIMSGRFAGESGDTYVMRLDSGSPLSYWTTDNSVDSNWKQLGDADFQLMLVADSSIQCKIASSAKKTNGLYHMGSSYDIAVVPSGIEGSWAEGHFDSFLMALWSLRAWDSGVIKSGGDVYKSVNSFYTDLLRCKGSWDGGVVQDWNNVVSGQ